MPTDKQQKLTLTAREEALAQHTQRLINRIDMPDNATVAYVGCGQGELVPRLLAQNPRMVVGIDKNKRNIERAHQRFDDGRATFVCADFLTADLGAVFDVVLFFETYELFPDKQALKAVVLDRLKHGGMAVICYAKGRASIPPSKRKNAPELLDPVEEGRQYEPQFAIDQAQEGEDFYFLRMTKLPARRGKA